MSTKETQSGKLRIHGKAIKKYVEIMGISQRELASWLNVNPASLTRWVDSTNPQSPTSTTFLVLIPFLLATGIDSFVPEVSEQEIADEFANLRGLVDESVIRKDSKKLTVFKHRIAIARSPEIKAARALFERLKEAWAAIDERKRIQGK